MQGGDDDEGDRDRERVRTGDGEPLHLREANQAFVTWPFVICWTCDPISRASRFEPV